MIRRLTTEFYTDYSHCSEICKKQERPYLVILVVINGLDIAIPFRSNINHDYVIWTDKTNNCGLDLSKAVIITDSVKYLGSNAQLRQNEFNAIKGKSNHIKQQMTRYIIKYEKALNAQHIKHNRQLCKFSTLQYFHKELGIR